MVISRALFAGYCIADALEQTQGERATANRLMEIVCVDVNFWPKVFF